MLLAVLVLFLAYSPSYSARCGHTKTCFCPDSETLLCTGYGYITLQMLEDSLPVSGVTLLDIRGRDFNIDLLYEVEHMFTTLKLLDIRDIDCSPEMNLFVQISHLFSVLSDCINYENSSVIYTELTSHENTSPITSDHPVTSNEMESSTVANKTLRPTFTPLTRKINLKIKNYNVSRPTRYIDFSTPTNFVTSTE